MESPDEPTGLEGRVTKEIVENYCPPTAILLGDSGVYVDVDDVAFFGRIPEYAREQDNDLQEDDTHFVKTKSGDCFYFAGTERDIKNLEQAKNFYYHQSITVS